MKIQNTLTPYKKLKHNGIQYGVCRAFDHISRYRTLRQLIHSPQSINERFVSLETPNTFTSQIDVDYYVVPYTEENRLDIISFKFLGTSQYAWIIAYLNGIEDGYTVKAEQRIKIPKSINQLFNKGEILASVSPLTLNLGYE